MALQEESDSLGKGRQNRKPNLKSALKSLIKPINGGVKPKEPNHAEV